MPLTHDDEDDWDDRGTVTYVGTPASLIDRAQRSDMRASLLVLAGSNTGEMVELANAPAIIGRTDQCTLQLRDSGISRRHCQVDEVDGHFFLEDLGSRNGTYANGKRISTRVELRDGDKIQLGRSTILRFSYQDHLDERFQRQLIDSALRDGMTGAYNRRYFLDRLDAEFKFAQRHDERVALLILDLDHFKQINDTYGHLAGDAALVAFAGAIQGQIRDEDVFARYGGEEFAVITRAIDLPGVEAFAERLRQVISGLVIEYGEHSFSLTMSVGIAAIPDHVVKDSVELVEAADRALYEAKRRGRNRISVYEALPPSFDETDDTRP